MALHGSTVFQTINVDVEARRLFPLMGDFETTQDDCESAAAVVINKAEVVGMCVASWEEILRKPELRS